MPNASDVRQILLGKHWKHGWFTSFVIKKQIGLTHKVMVETPGKLIFFVMLLGLDHVVTIILVPNFYTIPRGVWSYSWKLLQELEVTGQFFWSIAKLFLHQIFQGKILTSGAFWITFGHKKSTFLSGSFWKFLKTVHKSWIYF